MITASVLRLRLALLLCTASIAFVRADPPPAEDQFETLRKRFADMEAKFLAEYQKAKTEAERERITTPYPAHSMVDDFLKFEESHRGTQVGISALHHLVSQAATSGDADSPPAQGRQKALKILREYYVDHRDLDVLFPWLSLGARGPEDKPFLRRAAKSSQRHVRGTALLALAEYLAVEADLIPDLRSRLALVNTEPAAFAEEIKRWQTTLTELSGIDPVSSRREAMKLLERVAGEYADVLEAPRTRAGPALLKVEHSAVDPITLQNRRPLAELAESMQYKLTHLTIGQQAPETTGRDQSGKELKLSSQRGKVAVIMFSYKGCGPCEEMYPTNRKLIDTYRGRPFVLLGVMGNDLEIVKQLVAKKTITWRSWWDGELHGPIATQWNVSSWPTIYVLDHQGKIRYRNLRGDVLAKAVSQLVVAAENAR